MVLTLTTQLLVSRSYTGAKLGDVVQNICLINNTQTSPGMDFEILGADVLLGYYVCWPRYGPPELVFAEFKAIES